MLAQTFQFGEAAPGDSRAVLAAPQASIMQALVQGFMSRQPVAWLLFGAGAMIAVSMEMLRVPALIFALGMYLPLELNLPALVGGVLSHYVNKRSERAGDVGRGDARARRHRRVGLHGRRRARRRASARRCACSRGIARTWSSTPFYDIEAVSQLVSLVGFSLFCLYLWRKATRVRPEDGDGG